MLFVFGLTVRFGGGELLYYPDSDLVVLRDSGWVRVENTYLEADSVVFWKRKNILHAYKGFTLIVDQNTTRGESLKYNVRTGRGVAYDARGFVDKGWVRGKRIYKVSDNELEIVKGDFTTCELEKPHYQFKALGMRLVREDMAVVWPLVFQIMDIPVAAAPFWFFPVKRKRASGFLAPRIGYHSADGKYFRNIAYYFAASNYWDIILGVDLIERRGPRFFSTLNYNRYKSFKGKATFTFADDYYLKTRRWSLDGSHTQTLLGFDMGAEAHILSDLTYRQDYSEDKTEFLKTETESFVSVYRSFGELALSGEWHQWLDLIRGSYTERSPQVQLSLAPVSWGSLALSGGASFLRLLRRDTFGFPVEEGQRADASASLNLPQLSIKYLKLNPSLAAQGVYYPLLGTAQGLGSASLDLSTSLYGLSHFGAFGFRRFLHVLTPSLGFTYELPTDSVPVDTVAGGSTFHERFLVKFGVSNTWDGKRLRDTAKEVVRIANLNVGVTYDALSDSLYPFTASLDLFPQSPVSSRLLASWTPDSLLSVSVVTGARFTLRREEPAETTASDTSDTTKPKEEQVIEANRPPQKPWSFSLSHYYAPLDSANSVELAVEGNVTTRWLARYRIKYDIARGRVVDQSLSLTRDLHCWRMDFSWNTFGTYWTYNLSFVIKNLPDIELKRGFFELFLPK